MLEAALYQTFHQQRGEQIIWLKGIHVPVGTPGRLSDGVILQRQSIIDSARFLISYTKQEIESTPFGPIPAGTMQISAFPIWARFNHLDRVLLTKPGRLLSETVDPEDFLRGDGDEDELPQPDIASITNVWVDGVLVDPANYEATESGIRWLSNAPAEGVGYSVEYLFYPRYIVLPQSHQTSPTDADGNSLPIRYWLQRELSFGN